MRDVLGRRKKKRGMALTELALLFPIIFGLFLGFVQVVIYMQSRTATQYAAFAAARAFQVYGDRILGSIHYPRVREVPYTNDSQAIAEAAAEKIIFESLLWEHRKIESPSQALSLQRYYSDGPQAAYDGGGALNEGIVKVNFLGCTGAGGCDNGTGVEVTYCLPIVFPGIDFLFTTVKKENPCHVNSAGRSYSGIGITYRVEFGREPVEL